MNKNITLEHLELEAQEPKEEGYDEWLQKRLERTIQSVDSGRMPTYTTAEVRAHMKNRRLNERVKKMLLLSDVEKDYEQVKSVDDLFANFKHQN